MNKLGADMVTSCDRGGCRRFRSAQSKKWGFCTLDGTVLQEPRYDSASHCLSEPPSWEVILDGEKRYCEIERGYWIEMSLEQFAYQSTFGA